MSGKGHKRKRSIQDTPVDLSKMKLTMNHLSSLKEELADIQETEVEMDAVMSHVHALQAILETAKKPRLNFSSATKKDLEHLGIVRKSLEFMPKGIEKLLSRSTTPGIAEEIQLLHERLNEIYDHVNMDFEAGVRMIVDAILLSIARIVARRQDGHAVAILPEMRLGTGDGIRVGNPNSTYEMWLTGSLDYSIVQYPVEPASNKVKLLGVDASREEVFKVAAGQLFIVEAKRQTDTVPNLPQCMPEAVSQAVAVSEMSGQSTTRFCLSNGRSWIFAVLKIGSDKQRTYYEAPPFYLDRTLVQMRNAEALRSVQQIVELVLEWLTPSEVSQSDGLYKLSE